MEGVRNHHTISAPGSFASTLSKSAFAGPPLPHCSMPSRAWWLTSKMWLRKHRGAADPTIKL